MRRELVHLLGGWGVAGSVQTESEDSLKMLGDCWRLVISIEVKSI